MRILDDITKFIFVCDEPKPCDLIFIPGSSKYEISEKASLLYKQGLAKYVLPSGKFSCKLEKFPNEKIINKKYAGKYESDWEFCKEVLFRNDVPLESILVENKSTNTSENAFFSRKVTDDLNIEVKSAILCCQAFHARRALITYSLAYPNTQFYVVPVETQGISKNNWYKSDYGINRVLGELRKCGSYFEEYIKDLNKYV
ncbi:YdcF family protein [Clostridium perfringens]|nr:YdcF family protein [Clostridium perfringens]MDK0713229.1 YdcF family protein [Clostridium perfringens]